MASYEIAMNRGIYIGDIKRRFAGLVVQIELGGALNLLDCNLHSENFYRDLLNIVYSWKLVNLNTITPNAAGIDLVDPAKKILAQVSATATKQKIETTLSKDLSQYTGYSFRFVPICTDASDLTKKTFTNPHQLAFNPASDILDLKSLLRTINNLDIEELKKCHRFVLNELRPEPDLERIESNLSSIIAILSKENWSGRSSQTVPYDIEAKITHNKLLRSKKIIDEHKIHYSRIDKIYSECDRQGANKSISVLNQMQTLYCDLLSATVSPDDCFTALARRVLQIVKNSLNCPSIPSEELNLCVYILVVDAFIRCKIFENPGGQ